MVLFDTNDYIQLCRQTSDNIDNNNNNNNNNNDNNNNNNIFDFLDLGNKIDQILEIISTEQQKEVKLSIVVIDVEAAVNREVSLNYTVFLQCSYLYFYDVLQSLILSLLFPCLALPYYNFTD